jgi:hypothetical protein
LAASAEEDVGKYMSANSFLEYDFISNILPAIFPKIGALFFTRNFLLKHYYLLTECPVILADGTFCAVVCKKSYTYLRGILTDSYHFQASSYRFIPVVFSESRGNNTKSGQGQPGADIDILTNINIVPALRFSLVQ